MLNPRALCNTTYFNIRYKINMSEILSKWLNEEVQLSQVIGELNCDI